LIEHVCATGIEALSQMLERQVGRIAGMRQILLGPLRVLLPLLSTGGSPAGLACLATQTTTRTDTSCRLRGSVLPLLTSCRRSRPLLGNTLALLTLTLLTLALLTLALLTLALLTLPLLTLTLLTRLLLTRLLFTRLLFTRLLFTRLLFTRLLFTRLLRSVAVA
jgi:hypothetical protein